MLGLGDGDMLGLGDGDMLGLGVNKTLGDRAGDGTWLILRELNEVLAGETSLILKLISGLGLGEGDGLGLGTTEGTIIGEG